mmetsp:Transcript_24633/g.38283  ORF Transcript_24633/g.38283 Transcript_24633/m.38283 type:complete len:143 (-) Transcript_24633:180-608(-)
MLSSADSWAVDSEKAVVTKAYISQVFNKMTGKQEKKEEEEKKQGGSEPSQPTPQMPMNPGFGGGGMFGGNLREPPRQPIPHVIGDPVDPLRIGGPRGGGIPGNQVGPNHPMFNPFGNPLADPSIGGVPMWNDPEGGGSDLFP